MQFLRRRGRVYSVVVPVPVDLQTALGKKQIWRSLGTKCYANARSLGRQVVAEMDTLFIRVRFGMITREEIKSMVAEVGLRVLDFSERLRLLRARSADEVAETSNSYAISAETYEGKLATGDYDPAVRSMAKTLLKDKKVKLSETDPMFTLLMRELTQELITRSKIQAERVKGQYDTDYQHRVLSRWEANKPPDKGEPLSQLLNDYAIAWQGEPHRQKRKCSDCKLTIKYLTECFKRDLGVNELGRAELNALNDFFTKKKFQPKTINNRWELLAAAYNWGNDEGRFKIENPVKRIKLAVSDKRGKRKHLTAAEVNDYVHGITANQTATRPEKYWIPLLMMYTGARPGELAKLTPADVLEHDGILCLRLTSRKGRNKRSDTAVMVTRYLPVAKYLIDIGFGKFVSGCKTARLFSNCRLEKGTYYPSNLSVEMCGEIREYTGSADIDVYSIRHTFKMVVQKCIFREVREYGRPIPFVEFALADIMGHVHKGHHDGTYGAQQTGIMQLIIDLVNYEII